jgi:hypothetical protein
MDVTSDCDPTDFARQVLRGVSAIESPRLGQSDLCLELGLSLWMRQTGTGLDDAGPAMLAIRSALVLTSGMDLATEPVPLCGVDPRVDVLNLGAYLRQLVVRAAARAQCDAVVMVERVVECLRSGTFGSGRTATVAAG